MRVTLSMALAAAAVVLASCSVRDEDRKTLACSEPFDSKDWKDPDTDQVRRNQLAYQVMRCKLFRGEPRSRVEQALGRSELSRLERGEGPGTWFTAYRVAWVNDAYGPGDEQTLDIYYDRRQRLVRARLAPEGEPARGWRRFPSGAWTAAG